MITLSPATGIAAGTVIGAGYFAISESGVPKESNCTYLAPWTTDFAAWLAGIVLIKKGLDYQDPMITFMVLWLYLSTLLNLRHIKSSSTELLLDDRPK